MNRETEMLIESLAESRGKQAIFGEKLYLMKKRGMKKSRALSEAAESIKLSYRSKLCMDNSFGKDAYFRRILLEAIERADYMEAALWLSDTLGYSEGWD